MFFGILCVCQHFAIQLRKHTLEFSYYIKLSTWKVNAVLFVTNIKILNYLYIIEYSFLYNYLFISLIDYFNYFIDLFSSETLAILLSTNSKLNKLLD